MIDLEFIFTMLGEARITEIVKRSDGQGFVKNKVAAKQGGKIAGDARVALELKTGVGVVSMSNHLDPRAGGKPSPFAACRRCSHSKAPR